MNKAMKSAWRLRDEKIMKNIVRDFERQVPLHELSFDHDLSPVSLFRSIMASRVLDANPRLVLSIEGNQLGLEDCPVYNK